MLPRTMACSCMKMNEHFKSRCFTDLPDTVQVKIFRYLNVDDLFRVGRTCKKWYFLSRDSRFWTRVDIGDFNLMNMDYDRIRKFLPALPSCITRLKLQFIPCSEEKMTVQQLFLPIKQRCPELEVLAFHVCLISYNGQTNTNFCIFDHLSDSVRVFSCRKGELETRNFMTNKSSKQFYPLIVLDLSISVLPRGQTFFDIFTRMVNLRELRLAYCSMWDDDIVRIDTRVMSNLRILDLEGAIISHVAFNYIRRWCTRLEELYLCDSALTNEDIRVDTENHFERLEILCLRRTGVSDCGIARILRFCDSLHFVYVSYDSQLPRLVTLPIANRIKVLCVTRENSCRHYSKRNYMKEDY